MPPERFTACMAGPDLKKMGQRRVIVRLEGFDAAKAGTDAIEELQERLEAPFDK